MLPKNERVKVNETDHWRLWLYGESFSGKTYLANQFPNVLMLNTDGNTRELDAPKLRIADQYWTEGAVTKSKLAWDVFKDVIADLKKGSDYETVVIDLVEDFYEYCRLYMYRKLNITHESDDNYRAWDKVRTEFYSTMRGLLSLPYNFIIISQEDKSRDMSSKSGEKVTQIKPNIADKVAIKLEGMVTLVGRVICENDSRRIEFKGSDTVFGGSRVALKETVIPCTYKAVAEVLEHGSPKTENPREDAKLNEPLNPPKKKAVESAPAPVQETFTGAEETVDCSEDTPEEEQPVVRRRRRRTL